MSEVKHELPRHRMWQPVTAKWFAAIFGASLSLLTPAYFAKYFDQAGRLNMQGELAISVGVIGLFCLLAPALATLPMMPKALGGQR
jgi:hypothetical protein